MKIDLDKIRKEKPIDELIKFSIINLDKPSGPTSFSVSYYIKNDVKYFRAAKPEKLLDYLKEKENIILSILPNLKKLDENKSKKPLVEVYEDKEGMKTILNDIIRTKKEWLAIGSTGEGPYILNDFFIEKFHKERIKNKIKLKVLFNDTEIARKRALVFQKTALIQYKFLPQNYQNPTTIYTYGNKTALIMWLAVGKPFAILIESKEISNSFRNYFELIWRITEKNYLGALKGIGHFKKEDKAKGQLG